MEIIERLKEKVDINLLSPLTWAYVGDAVYELYIRTNLVNNTKLKPHKLHIESIKYVRRGRNAENHHLPKNADPQDYMYSTAFEGLIGFLYLTKQDERLKEILQKSKHE